MMSILRLGALSFAGAIAFASPAMPATLAGGLEGRWTAEQTGADAGAPKQAMLTFVDAAGSLVGTMRAGADDMPLFDVREMGTDISFTLVIPGSPYLSIHYLGARSGDEIKLTGSDENRAVYTLNARRIAAAVPAVQAAAAPSSPAQTAPAPVALLNPAPAAAPAPRADIASASGRLDGNWTAEQTRAGAAAPSAGSLVFTGNRGTMHVGADDWPLFDVRDAGADVAFTLVIPGTPYITVRYAGTVAGDMLQLAGLDADRGAFHLTARRAGATTAPVLAARRHRPARRRGIFCSRRRPRAQGLSAGGTRSGRGSAEEACLAAVARRACQHADENAADGLGKPPEARRQYEERR